MATGGFLMPLPQLNPFYKYVLYCESFSSCSTTLQRPTETHIDLLFQTSTTKLTSFKDLWSTNLHTGLTHAMTPVNAPIQR